MLLLLALGFPASTLPQPLQEAHEESRSQESALDWAGRFWAGDTRERRDAIAADWIAEGCLVEEVARGLREGRTYAEDAPSGYHLTSRIADDGTVFPYLVLIPDDYDPSREWPLRFQLHGGMGAPAWDASKAEWAGGWNRTSDYLMVHPAGWWDAMWWEYSQVENFEAILRTMRATWNIDEDRVLAVGNSDGGAALFFHAMRRPDRFAAWLGHVAPPDRLTRADFRPDGQCHLLNLKDQKFLFGYGEKDKLVPIKHLRRYMELFQEFGADLVWYALPGQGHQLDIPDARWKQFFDFMANARRDPFPDTVSWATEDPSRYGRRSWVRVDALGDSKEKPDGKGTQVLPRWGTSIQLRGKTVPRVPFGEVHVRREGNTVTIESRNVTRLTLLLGWPEFTWTEPIVVSWNGMAVHEGAVIPSAATMLHWAARDDDRKRLVAAELALELPEPKEGSP